ncbi:MAG: hypothetical protein GY757_55055, partial [bacterium]|nr:hypothetical protein [bacterium]
MNRVQGDKTMTKRNKKKDSKEKPAPKKGAPEPPQDQKKSAVHWQENTTYIRRPFPGPSRVMVPLRVAIDRGAFVNMTDHVMKSIDEEVCGVMIGEVCTDDEGLFVQVRTIIKGSAAHQGGAHVTFTHDTWNQIYLELEQDYPDYNILGWYHSHPGFGVVFSEMDIFIQRNFFSSPTQFALVVDPLGGEKALCVKTGEEVQYIDKFWVDGREHRAFQPDGKGSGGVESTGSTHSDKSIAMMETRLTQVLQAVDILSRDVTRVLTIMGSSVLALIVAVVFYIFFF